MHAVAHAEAGLTGRARSPCEGETGNRCQEGVRRGQKADNDEENCAKHHDRKLCLSRTDDLDGKVETKRGTAEARATLYGSSGGSRCEQGRGHIVVRFCSFPTAARVDDSGIERSRSEGSIILQHSKHLIVVHVGARLQRRKDMPMARLARSSSTTTYTAIISKSM